MMRMRVVLAALLLAFVLELIPSQTTRASLSQQKKTHAGSPFVPGRLLVQFRSETLSTRSAEMIVEAGALDIGQIAGLYVHMLELPDGVDEESLLRSFKSRPEVEFAELDRILPPEQIAPDDPWYVNWEWQLRRIECPTAWLTSTGNSVVTIAILDTGVDGSHEDLSGKMVPGWNVYDSNSDTRDVNGHGTMVAGTAAASSNNAKGVASIAWGCRIMPIRISDANGYGYYSTMASGLTWAADHGARIANLSYRASTSATVASAAQYFQSKGGVVTIAAGNEGIFDSAPDNPYVLTVSGTDSNDQLYSWSNTGNNIDIAAPGWAYTTVRGGGYSAVSGTSFAAPIVAGVAALVISVNPGLSGQDVQNVLTQSADDRGPGGWDTSFGSGRVNAARALSIASGGGGPGDTTQPAVNLTSPAANSNVSGSISVQATATDNVGVVSVSASVDGVSLGIDVAAPYSFPWNTVAFSNGTHTVTASARDAAGNIGSSSITVNVNNSFDTVPPVIAITAPSNGNAVSGNVSVVVNASDNVGVSRVELYVDGLLTATSTSAPFGTRWNARRAGPGAHALMCRANDAAGNAANSPAVIVYK